MSRALADVARATLGALCLAAAEEKGEVELLVDRARIVEALRALRDEGSTQMRQLMTICAADYPDRNKRFEIVYALLSPSRNERVRLIVRADEEEKVPTATGVFPSAGWFERETFDMFGIEFEGHPDLRRILTDTGFEGYPLRRDFPVVGFTQVRYDDLHCRVVREPVRLEQDDRTFDAQSPWLGRRP